MAMRVMNCGKVRMVVPLVTSWPVGSPSPRASMTRPARSGSRSWIWISTPGPSRTTEATLASVTTSANWARTSRMTKARSVLVWYSAMDTLAAWMGAPGR